MENKKRDANAGWSCGAERERDKESAEELTVSGSYMKNCDPLVFLPRLAMDNRKGFSCFSVNSSSEMWKCY